MKAFRLAPEQRAALQRDAAPTSVSGMTGVKIFIVLVIIVIVLLMARCGRSSGADCDQLRSSYGDTSNEYRNCLAGNTSGSRTSGGAYGGFSSGGGHK